MMIFERICLKNIFSYYGEVAFDIAPPPRGKKNVAIIWGRNGYGKTSFLNSIKLFFVGADEVRSTALGDTQYSVTGYIAGQGADWHGILNRAARRENQNEFFVQLTWREDAGRVVGKRSWTLENGRPVEQLSVDPEFAKYLVGDEAQDFLGRRMPKHLLPFFIYDGEQVQRLAEANRQSQMQQIEKLLDLAALDALVDYMDRNIVDWRRQGLEPAEQARFQRLSHELGLLDADQKRDESKKQELDDQVRAKEFESERVNRFLDSMRAFALQRDEADIRSEHQHIKGQLEAETQKLFDDLMKEAPLLVNPSLVIEARDLIRRGASDPANHLFREINAIFSKLPALLFDEPPFPTPAFTQGQIDFSKRKLQKLAQLFALDRRATGEETISLPPAITDRLMSRLEHFSQSRTDRVRIAASLRHISNLKGRLAELEARLDDITHLADAEKTSFRERKQQLEELKLQRDSLFQEAAKLDGDISRRKAEMEVKRREIDDQERRVKGSKELSLKVTVARQIQTTFRDYRQALKDRRRAQIEEAINLRFHQLMSSHRLIDKIVVNDTFGLDYLDEKKRSIGLANISAGMKQLVAQSLLWALKDVSGKSAPLVIDTPLARIDRRHQENLLEKYLPKAGTQVIVLPTDSEIDERKYKLLQPHIYTEYRLENPAGDRTSVTNGSIYSVAA